LAEHHAASIEAAFAFGRNSCSSATHPNATEAKRIEYAEKPLSVFRSGADEEIDIARET